MPFTHPQEPLGSSARNDDAADGSIHGSTVLLLEDEALIAVALQADLEDAGYTVAGPFVACAAALGWLESQKPDLAILDTVLRDGPCKEVALKLTDQGVPFLIYSGHAEDVNRLPGLASVNWIEKPATAQVLVRALAQLKTLAALST